MPSRVLNTKILPAVGEIKCEGGPAYVYHPFPPPDEIAKPSALSCSTF
ncbi:hypothetical protein [Urechidicola sp. KH5]